MKLFIDGTHMSDSSETIEQSSISLEPFLAGVSPVEVEINKGGRSSTSYIIVKTPLFNIPIFIKGMTPPYIARAVASVSAAVLRVMEGEAVLWPSTIARLALEGKLECTKLPVEITTTKSSKSELWTTLASIISKRKLMEEA